MPRSPSPRVTSFAPLDGGQLFRNPSRGTVGGLNYYQKRNWRRVDNMEQIREGHDCFWTNMTGDYADHPGAQPFPNLATRVTISEIAYSAGTITVTFSAPHDFQVGEVVQVEGVTENNYDGYYSVSETTLLTVSLLTSSQPAARVFAGLGTVPETQPESATGSGDMTIRSAEPINLIVQGVRPNGRIALVVGTRTTLFRYFPNDGDPYVVDGYWVDGYVDDVTAGWLKLGGGYSVDGSRWQSDTINGYLILNNAKDLPVTYRVEEFEVFPIYELREDGIVSVGRIRAFNTVLNCTDIRQFKTDELLPWMLPIGIELHSGITAYQTGTTVTFSTPVATADDVGKFIEYEDGDVVEITAFGDPQTVTVADSMEKENLSFRYRIKGSKAGAYSSLLDGGITATLDSGTMTVTLSSAPTTPGTIGYSLRFANGFESVITAINSPTEYVLTVADDPGEDFTAQVFWITNELAHVVHATLPLFTEDMVGRIIYFENGDTRRIEQFIDDQNVVADGDTAVSGEFISVENPDAYGRVDNTSLIDRIHWRRIWGELEEPRRFAAAIDCKVTNGSRTVVMDYAAKSIEDGQTIVILGAGVDGGNVTATVLSVAANRFIQIDQDIETTMSTQLAQSDSIGGLTGFEDLEDDGSGILNMMPLQDTLVIYKETAIFLSNYTGEPGTPFSTRRRLIPPNTGLYFSNTLITFERNWHIYAGRNSFYRFNLTDQVPQIMPAIEGCRSIFFDGASRADKESIFAADNALTKETWFVFPGGEEAALILDQRFGLVTTTDRRYGAMAIVTKPTADAVQSESDILCLASIGERLLIYGLANADLALFGGREIFYVRDQYPFAHQQLTYTAVLESGMDPLGDPDSEKDIIDFIPYLGSWSDDCPLKVELLGAWNPKQTPEVKDVRMIDQPVTDSLFSTFFRTNYVSDRITVEARGQKLTLALRQYRSNTIGSRSITRSPGKF